MDASMRSHVQVSRARAQIEADEPDPAKAELTEADLALMQEVLVSNERVVLSKENYDKITNQLSTIKAEYSRTKKMLYLYSNCSEQFIEEIISRVDDLNIAQLEFLWSTYEGMLNNFEMQGFACDEEATVSSLDSAREDVRQLIFHTRRDGKWNTQLKSIKDIKL